MIVFDVVVNGEVKETLQPSNQRLHEIHWYIVDRVQELKVKYNNNFELSRRLIYL